ncbi:MAG: hypothetical protein ACI9G1_005658, partial [Pirellulaceae bacterium]
MPTFKCQTCDTDFEIPQETMDKYVDWVPKYCRKHAKVQTSKDGKQNVGKLKLAPREENLTLAEVLEKYTDGPDSG